MSKKGKTPESDFKPHTQDVVGTGYVAPQNVEKATSRPSLGRSGISKVKSKRRGRPPKYSEEDRARAYDAYMMGDTPREIAAVIGCSARTVRHWVAVHGWEGDLRKKRETAKGLEAQILRLSRKKNPTTSDAQRLAMLTKSLERVKKMAPAPKPRPIVQNAVHKDTLEQVLSDDYGLYAYQRDFLLDESRFRIVLKARQIGFSYVVGLAVLLGALAGRPQIVVSASIPQAQIILNYVRMHAKRLQIHIEKDLSSQLTIAGTQIVATSTNFRTAQGWPGDVWFDEFAWVRQQDMLWAAVVPSITAIGGRVTVFSTPFLPNSLFWRIATNHQNKYDHFSRKTYTIHDAIDQGMNLPGGVEELRMLFDGESWAMFYECQWAEDGAALLSWELLHKLTSPFIDPDKYGRLHGGVDVGRINDRTAAALVGEEFAGKKWLGKYALLHQEMHKGMPFASQKKTILGIDQRFDVEEWRIDKTGLGYQLAEELEDVSSRFNGVHFSAGRKSKLALNMLKLCEDRKLVLPNDPDVLAQLHSIKKTISGTTIKYDADRTEEGHGDLFWAVALAAQGRAGGQFSGGGVGVEVLT